MAIFFSAADVAAPKFVSRHTDGRHKFLVKGDAWRALARGTTYRQGYLNGAKERPVRIRTAMRKPSFLERLALPI